MPAIAIDATPLTHYPGAYGGHAVRGIGRYVAGVLRSLADEAPEWSARHLLPVHTADVGLDWWPGETVVTRRVRHRPQDAGWWTAPVLDGLALGRRSPAAWLSTDPTAPLQPPRTGRAILVAYDLIPLADRRVLDALRPHRRAVYRLFLRRLRRADLVVAISHTVADELHQRLRVARSRICVVYPGLSARPAAEPTDAGTPDLLFVGVPGAHKNAGSAIDALAEVVRRGHDVRLRFVGTHPSPARQELRLQAARSGMGDRVAFLDQVADEQLAALYRTSVLLAPSSIEGLGLTPIEALLHGGHAICGPAPVFRETLGEFALFADPAQPAEWADAYESLAAQPAGQAPAAVVERFSPAASARAAIDAFERFLG